MKLLSRVWLLATPWTAAYQAPPSMGFSRQGYWSGVPLPSKCLLSMCKVQSVLLTIFGFSVKVQSITLIAVVPRWGQQSVIHIYNSTLPLPTIVPLCIFLEKPEWSFYFVLGKLWHRMRIYHCPSRKCTLCSVYYLEGVLSRSHTMSANGHTKFYKYLKITIIKE